MGAVVAGGSRFLIGIDLGTTNTAVAAVDARSADPRVERLEIAQLVAPGEVSPRRQLPAVGCGFVTIGFGAAAGGVVVDRRSRSSSILPRSSFT